MAARRASASSLASHGAGDHDNPFSDDPNVFSDNYAESIAESFADSIDARSVNHGDSADDAATSSPDTIIAPAPELPRRPAMPSPWAGGGIRGSLRKSLGSSAAAAGQSEDAQPSVSATSAFSAGTASFAQRSASTASSLSFARSQSPQQSGNGPSHPYAMYPQALGISRSPSTATTSTVRSPTFPSGRQGPTHPYALYPQNIPEDLPQEEDGGSRSIPVGFPGHGNSNFRRRLGPEGEVQEIIGPDGHSEQLPPYTRYPEESAAKVTDALLPPIGDGPQEPSSPEHALLFPRRPHNFDESQPEPVEQRRRGSERGLVTKYEDSDRSWKDLSWNEKKRQKVLGVPLWFFLVIMVGIVIIAAVCGGVIGGVLGRHQATDDVTDVNAPTTYTKPPIAEVYTVTTTMIDASEATTTPSSLPALPTGNFKVDVGEQTSTSQNCLPLQEQRRAWSCSLNPDTFMVQVDFNMSNGGLPSVTLENYYKYDLPQYGAQPPQVYGQTLKLATDLNNPELGLAYQFQILYDKLVVVDSSSLAPPDSSTKRGLQDYSLPMYTRKQVAPLDQPWFCYWNSTLLEGFIYVENDTLAAVSAGAASSSLGAMSQTAALYGSTALPTPSPASTTEGVESKYDYTVPYMTPDQSTPTNLAKHARPWVAPASTQPGTAYLQDHTLVVGQRRDMSSDTCYPKRIKIEERRLWQDRPVSYCQQMYTNEQGQLVPMLDDDNELVQIDLTEVDAPAAASKRNAKREQLGMAMKRALPSTGCYCQWQTT